MLADYLDPNYDPSGVNPLHDDYGGTYATQAPMDGPLNRRRVYGDPGAATVPVARDIVAGNPQNRDVRLPDSGSADSGITFPSYPISSYTPGMYGGGGSFNPGPAPTFSAPAFTAPRPEDIANDPGYQFRLNQGLQGMERGAAARGALLTGGQLKDEQQYGQSMAAQEYDAAYNRALDTWQRTQYAPALAAYQAAYDPWYAQGNWGNQQFLQGNQIDYNAWNAYNQALLAQQGYLVNTYGIIAGQ